MRLSGRVFRDGGFWAIEVPMLGVVSQGRSKNEAFLMIADAVESLVNKQDFHIEVYPGKGGYFEMGSLDDMGLIAFLLRRQRAMQGLSLAEVSMKLGGKSVNEYARYEQGRSVPTVKKLHQLLNAVTGSDFVLGESLV